MLGEHECVLFGNLDKGVLFDSEEWHLWETEMPPVKAIVVQSAVFQHGDNVGRIENGRIVLKEVHPKRKKKIKSYKDYLKNGK